LIFFFAALLVTSCRVSVIVYANQERQATGSIGKTFSAGFIFLAVGIIASAVIFIIFQKYLRIFAGITLQELIFLGTAFLGWTIKEFIVTTFYALDKKIESALAEIAFGVTALSALIIFFLSGAVSLNSVFSSYFIALIGAVLVGLIFIDRKLLAPFGFDKGHFQQILTFSLWTVFGVMSAYLINWGGLAVMRKFTSFAETGAYNLAFKFFKGYMALIYLIPAYFLPHISSSIDNVVSMKSYLYRKRPRILLLGSAGLVLAYFVTPVVLRLLYKDKFIDCIPAVNILLIAVAAFLYSSFYATVFSALKEYKFIQVAAVSQVIVNMILNFALIPSMGMAGAAAATSISFVYLAIISEVYFRRKLKNKLLGAG